MRKLPIYLVLDTSGSMMGEPIEQVKTGLQMLVSALRQDPYALETAYLSVVTFDTNAQQVVPLTDLASFQAPELKIGATTSLGHALEVVSECRDREVAATTAEVKGDWRPMVFIMTDGMPTDDWRSGLAKFKQRRWGVVVGCAVGDADIDVLREVAGEAVVRVETADPGAIQAFFKWVSASISTSSQKIETNQGEVEGLNELPPPPPEIELV